MTFEDDLTRSIPHFGHFPRLSDFTSGCMGHVYLGMFGSESDFLFVFIMG